MCSGSWLATTSVRRARGLCEHVVEERAGGRVEAGIGLVQEQELGPVQEDAAESEPLLHSARERPDALVPRFPEAEALEQAPMVSRRSGTW